jgi:hypothetical protein
MICQLDYYIKETVLVVGKQSSEDVDKVLLYTLQAH